MAKGKDIIDPASQDVTTWSSHDIRWLHVPRGRPSLLTLVRDFLTTVRTSGPYIFAEHSTRETLDGGRSPDGQVIQKDEHGAIVAAVVGNAKIVHEESHRAGGEDVSGRGSVGGHELVYAGRGGWDLQRRVVQVAAGLGGAALDVMHKITAANGAKVQVSDARMRKVDKETVTFDTGQQVAMDSGRDMRLQRMEVTTGPWGEANVGLPDSGGSVEVRGGGSYVRETFDAHYN
jgi:hypothetical protein